MTRSHPNSGFTLVELSVLIGILGVVMGFAVVGTMSLVRSSRLAGAANTLVGDLRYARTLAATERRDHEVRFASGQYSIVRVSPARTVLTRVAPSGVTYSADDTVSCFAWGLTTPVNITVANDYYGSRVIRLSSNGSISRD